MSAVNGPSLTSPALAARSLLRRAFKGALATLTPGSGVPNASLVLVGTDSAGAALMLLSDLAVHSRNLAADGRASLLIDATDGLGDPMAGGRVTITGTVKKIADTAARTRFLARHPGASGYADFADFHFYRLEPMAAHLIQGFGRIIDIPGRDMVIPPATATFELQAAELLALLASRDFSSASYPQAGPWRAVGIDPEGLDLVGGQQARRLVFSGPGNEPIDRASLMDAVARARDA